MERDTAIVLGGIILLMLYMFTVITTGEAPISDIPCELITDTQETDFCMMEDLVDAFRGGGVGLSYVQASNDTQYIRGYPPSYFLPINTTISELNAIGNITAENVFLPSFVFAHSNSTIAVATAGSWYNVTFGEHECGIHLRINHTHNDSKNDTFTITDTGYYNIHYAMSFASSNAAPTSHIVMRVVKNEAEIEGSLLEEDATIQYSDFTISNGPIAYLVTGDEIKFQFTSDDTDVSLTSHRSYGVHHDTAVIKIIRIY